MTEKGDYTDPKTRPGMIMDNTSVDLLCADFTKVDPLKDGKENMPLPN